MKGELFLQYPVKHWLLAVLGFINLLWFYVIQKFRGKFVSLHRFHPFTFPTTALICFVNPCIVFASEEWVVGSRDSLWLGFLVRRKKVYKQFGVNGVFWCKVLTCLERLSLVWVCWVCCGSERPCCPAALLRRVWGWEMGGWGSMEQEAFDELSSTDSIKPRGKTIFNYKLYIILVTLFVNFFQFKAELS